MNVGQTQNQYAGKGSSRQVYLPLNRDGRLIDLDLLYDDNNDEVLDQIKNTEERTNSNLDIKVYSKFNF